MSKNAKNRRKVLAKRAMRDNKPGPKRTTPKHNKQNAWYQIGKVSKPVQKEEATA